MSAAPALRLRSENQQPLNADGRYVLYWMTAFRRTRSNFALEHAIHRAQEHGRPLLVLEGLRAGYEHASDRLHRFVLDGMADNAARFAKAGVAYLPYVEPARGAGRGLLAALAREAVLVVGDRWPCFFLPRMLAAAAARLPVRLESVDACGILPLQAATQAFPSAYAFRRFLQRTLRPHLEQPPQPDPLARRTAAARRAPLAKAPAAVRARWPAADPALLAGSPALLAALPVRHDVAPVAQRGGAEAGRAALQRFVTERLARYGERNDPASEVTSGLSPYLHFGHVGAHEVLAAVLAQAGFAPERMSGQMNGQREGWWGLPPAVEGFLDQLVTWRELGFNAMVHQPRPTSFEALPAWALRTLSEHARDPRAPCYDLATLEAARTHDPLWNAAQRQLLGEGRIHNYLRMLWGKKVLEWSRAPEEALTSLIVLNDRHAVDGRDPNSYNGILWTLGRFDRPWGPERPIFGLVRYMSSDNTRRKLHVDAYLARYGGPASEAPQGLLFGREPGRKARVAGARGAGRTRGGRARRPGSGADSGAESGG